MTIARWRRPLVVGGVVLGVLLLLGAAGWFYLNRAADDPRNGAMVLWARGDAAARASLVTVQRETCPGAPFVLPASGFIGLLYGDPRGPYSSNHRHQGIDIFSDSDPGTTPVYAAYDGYITREADWVSTLIQRVPRNPLNPDEQIWLYYTHMADATGKTVYIDPAFPPGTRELFVPQGTLLGYTGNYNGAAGGRIWTHLHFSIVRDDGHGHYLNELEIANTLDPSPFLGMVVNYTCQSGPATCTAAPTCANESN